MSLKTEIERYEFTPQPAMEEAFKRIYTLSPKVKRSLVCGPEGVYGSTVEIAFSKKTFRIEDVLKEANGETKYAILSEITADQANWTKKYASHHEAEIAMILVCGEEIPCLPEEKNGSSN